MNITTKAPRYGTWDHRKFQHLLAASVAALAIGVAVAVGVTNLNDSDGTSPPPASVSFEGRSQDLPTYFYIVDSQEKADLVATSEAELAMAGAGNALDHHTQVIDISTVEGQQLLEVINLALSEYGGEVAFQTNYRLIDWTD